MFTVFFQLRRAVCGRLSNQSSAGNGDNEMNSGRSERVVDCIYKYYDEKWYETFYSFPSFLSMFLTIYGV